MTSKTYIKDYGAICALGADKQQILSRFLKGDQGNLRDYQLTNASSAIVATVPDSWLDQTEHTRNNTILLKALTQIKYTVVELLKTIPPERIGVVMGTSTSGVLSGEQAFIHYHENQALPEHYHYSQQEMGDTAHFVRDYFGLKGPSYSISTACSSSGKTFASAQALLNSDVCDAVICGGADSLCQLTTQGFAALEAVSSTIANPFSINRDGINIGEGAAVFVLQNQSKATTTSPLYLAGTGESSDAHHISAPDPSGKGAIKAMLSALEDAQITAEQIDYLNCHGTGTQHNDAMESKAVAAVLGSQTLCSSTKPLTGHTLGAAGAIEAALCCLLLEQGHAQIPSMLWDNQVDPDLDVINLVTQDSQPQTLTYCMSNSFAFGGSNVSLIFAKETLGNQ